MNVFYSLGNVLKDFIQLNIDYIRLTLWSIGKRFGLFRVRRDSICPCRQEQQTVVDIKGRQRVHCAATLKYHWKFFRALQCPWQDVVYAPLKVDVCARELPVRLRRSRVIIRYLATGLFLGLVWGAILLGGRWGYPRLRAYVRPGPAVERITPATAPMVRSQARSRQYIVSAEARIAAQQWAEARIEYLNAVQSDPENLKAHLGLGRCALQLNRAAEAVQAFEKVLAHDPSSFDAYLNLARVARGRGDVAEALRLAGKANELNPTNRDARLLMSICRQANGETEAAWEEAQIALQLDPASTNAWMMSATLDLALNRPDQAERAFRKSLELGPQILDARIGLAKVLWVRGQRNEAIEALQAIVSSAPDDSNAAAELATLQVAAGSLEKAIGTYQVILARHPEFHFLRAQLAEILMLAGKVNASYLEVTRLLANHTNDIPGHLVLANLLLRQGFTTLASEQCRQVLQLDPQQVNARKLLVKALIAEGTWVEAVGVLEKLIKVQPDDLDMRLNLAFCYESLGKEVEAEMCLKTAAQQHPDSALPYVELAQIDLRRNNKDNAIKHYRLALAKAPDQVIALNNLAALLLEQSASVDEGLRLATQVWKLAPSNPMVSDTMGWAHFRHKDFKPAIGLLTYAVTQQPANPTPRYHLAAALNAVGQFAAARGHLEAALAVSDTFDDHERARTLLAEVRDRKDTAQP